MRKRRTIIITSTSGAHVPAWGRLAPGAHHDIELNDEQIEAIKGQGGAVMSAAEYKKKKPQGV